MEIKFLEHESWYGACVKYGMKMPICQGMRERIEFDSNPTPNQAMPMLVSTRGRSLWRENGFSIDVQDDVMSVPDDCILEETGGGLKEAYKNLCKEHFPFREQMPAEELFCKVIYNTWIELTFYQNEKAIMEYATKILENQMPPGVLMIDDGWAEYYGDWKFHSGKFPHPEEMLKRLHDMGYQVMLWVCPYIASDSVKFREARDLGLLIRTPDGDPYIAKWWNGFSAVLDMSNPQACEWLKKQLDDLMRMGVDGFKFDAGDSLYYREDNVTYGNTTPDEQSRLWAEFGEAYPMNEYRVTFKAGGYALMQRLCDKEHSWGANGVASLIPDTLLQGITGHPYGCPDMIGGGEYLNFQDAEKLKLDEELFVRHCEIACLMPAMQFSAAPFRVLSKENFAYILKSIETRMQYLPYIMEQIRACSREGEPLVRYMTYEFPEERVEKITDQFMLGSRYLVAPVYEKGAAGRMVYLPKGNWVRDGERIVSTGESVFCSSQMGIPIIFEKES